MTGEDFLRLGLLFAGAFAVGAAFGAWAGIGVFCIGALFA